MTKDKLKFLQVGLGSMGKRRIRNFLALGIDVKQITGFDLSRERCAEVKEKYGVTVFSDFKLASQSEPDVYIVSTPPDHHAEYFLHAARNKKHFFVELPTSDDGYEELFKIQDGTFVAAPSCSYRFLPPIKKVISIAASGALGKIYWYSCHLGMYLPDWHPWEDYRSVFFAQKDTGGCREMMPIELDWQSQFVQSFPVEVKAITRKVSDLDMRADDVYSAIVTYENGAIGNVVIELLSRTPKRALRIVGSLGTLEWDWQDKYMRVFEVKNKQWQEVNLIEGRKEKNYVVTEDMYEEEMFLFLSAILEHKPFPHDFKADQKMLNVLLAIDKDGQEKGTSVE